MKTNAYTLTATQAVRAMQALVTDERHHRARGSDGVADEIRETREALREQYWEMKEMGRLPRVVQVPSDSDPSGFYAVTNRDGTLSCTCPDYFYRGGRCKHIRTVVATHTRRS